MLRSWRSLLKLPRGFDGALQTVGASFHAVVVRGRAAHQVVDETELTPLDPGSYFGSEGAVAHQLTCAGETDCLVYVRAEGAFELLEA